MVDLDLSLEQKKKYTSELKFRIGNSMALQIVLSYLEYEKLVLLQALCRRFYNVFSPTLIETVILFPICSTSRGIIVFPGEEGFVNLLDFNQSLDWIQQPIISREGLFKPKASKGDPRVFELKANIKELRE